MKFDQSAIKKTSEALIGKGISQSIKKYGGRKWPFRKEISWYLLDFFLVICHIRLIRCKLWPTNRAIKKSLILLDNDQSESLYYFLTRIFPNISPKRSNSDKSSKLHLVQNVISFFFLPRRALRQSFYQSILNCLHYFK